MKLILLLSAIGAIIFVAAHQYSLRSKPDASVVRDDVKPQAELESDQTIEPDLRDRGQAETPPEFIDDPPDDPFVERRMVDRQVQLMEEYARNADPDDPFALSQEEIEEFRERGDPYVW